MNKRSVTLIFTILITVLLITSISASIKPNRDTYTTKDSVYILSTVGVGDNLCRSQNPTDNVKVYIVDHKSDWDDGDSFEDVRGTENEIPNEKFSNTKIWDNPRVGVYDLVVDCDEDLEYDEASEPIYSNGFEIVPKKGQGSMSLGHRNPENFKWQYDPENEILSKVVMQIELKALDENLNLDEIKLQIKSPQETNNIEIYFDKNNNGILDQEDEDIAKEKFAQKEQIIFLDHEIRQDIEENFIIIFNNQETTSKGDYSIKIVSISSIGIESGDEIKFFGNPLESNIMKVIDKKSCLGELELDFNPNPSNLNEETIAKASGLTGCDDLIVKLKSNECHIEIGDLGECKIENNECEITINAVKGSYFVCADKNLDGNYNGFGESKSSELKILEENKINEITEIKSEESEDEKDEPAKVTGNVIGNFNGLELSNTLVILVEITLLLILAFLALIFYRIIKPEKKEEIKEDDSDIFEEIKDEVKENKIEDEKDEIFEELEERKKEIVDKVEKDKKSSKKK